MRARNPKQHRRRIAVALVARALLGRQMVVLRGFVFLPLKGNPHDSYCTGMPLGGILQGCFLSLEQKGKFVLVKAKAGRAEGTYG